MKKKIKFDFDIKKRLIPVIILSICIPLVLFVAIPFEVYANNLDEFLFSLSSFYPLCILFGFILAVIIACSLLFLKEKAFRVTYAVYLALSLLLVLQGTFLNFGMDSLAGDALGNGTVHIGLKILDVFIWVAVIAVAVVLSLIKDKKGIIPTIAVILSIVIVATQIINPVINTINHPDVFTSKIGRLEAEGNTDYEILTNENLTAVASQRNVYYFCIDRFDEFFAETAYESNPHIYDNLDGFTWFKDNLSLFGHTFPSVPYMLTEKPYSVEQTRKEYLSDVYTDNNTLSVLKDNGYSVNLYTQAYYAYNTANELPDYVSNVSVAKQFETTNPMKLMGCMIGTAGFRCLPLFFKDWLFGIESATFNECVTSVGDNGQLEYASDNDVVYKKAAAATFETNGEKNFSFIHVMGCHTLMFDYISLPVTSLQKSNITSVVEESLDIVNEYINVLKEKNLYKDATIIITGDHPNPINNLGAPAGAKLTALFFKPSGSDATPIVQSNAPVAHENIWPAIMKSENITRSNERAGLFDIAENDVNHERKYIWHTYVSNQCDEYVYSIKGSGKNFDNWTLVETNHVDRFLMA